MNPEDFDYPMSSIFRGYSYEYCGERDPGYVPESIAELKAQLNDLQAIVAEPGSVPRQYYNQLQQLRGEVAYLRTKVAEMRAKRQKRYEVYDG
jgi:hypothetical protein